MADVNLDIVAAVGARTLHKNYDLQVSESQMDSVKVELRGLGFAGGRLVGFHFGTLDPVKRYPIERFAALADHAAGLGAATLALPSPDEAAAMTEFLTACSGRPLVAPLGRISRLAAWLQTCDVVVCNDSGILHMAAAVGTPTLSFHSRGHPDIWKPVGEAHLALYAGPGAISDIPVSDAQHALETLLGAAEET